MHAMMKFLLALALGSTFGEMARLVKTSSRESIWQKLNFHLEPSFNDTQSCDIGQQLGESECQEFSQKLAKHWQAPHSENLFEIINKKSPTFGCFLGLSGGLWDIKFNKKRQGPKKHRVGQVRVCSGVASEQAGFFQFGPSGAASCGHSINLTLSECAVAALQALINGGHGVANYRHLDKHVKDSDPVGCFVRPNSGGDNLWTISYKESPLVPQPVDYTKWRPVCAAAVKASHNGTAVLETGAQKKTGCGLLRHEYCSSTECYNCATRRRQACSWWRDSVCCASPFCQAR